MSLPFDAALVSAFFLAMLRASGWLFSTPPFANRQIPARVKVTIAVGLALASAPMIANPPPFGSVAFINSAFLQIFVGVAMGVMTQVLFAIFEAAGSLIDVFAGFTISQFYDPMSESQSTIFARLYTLIAITLLFVTGAVNLMVRGFLSSFTAIPANGIRLNDLQHLLTNELSRFLVAAIEIAAPVLIVLFLAEVILGILAKAAPSLNVFAVGFPLRVIVALTAVTAALPLLLPAVSNIADEVVHNMGM